MSDLDLAELRAEADALIAADRQGSMGFRPHEVLALLDRIEALEAERDEYKKQADCWSLAEQEVQTLEAERDEARRERDGYRAMSRNHNADSVAQRERADRAEARLARVTDDSMAERIRGVLMQKRMNVNTSGGKQEADAQAVLATIRAVAADEQEAGR